MKTFLIISGAVTAAGGLYAGGAFDRGEVYPLPIDTVRAELVGMPFPRESLFSSGASSAAGVEVDSAQHLVSWKLTAGGHHAATFRARLKPVRGGTRVILEHLPGEAASQADKLTATRFMRSYADATFAERVDAQLEGRSYDEMAAARAFAQDIHDDPEKVRELGLAVQGMFKEVAEQARAGANGGPPDHSYSPYKVERSMNAATRPAVNLPIQR